MIEIQAAACPQNHPCPVIKLCPTEALKQEGFSAPTVDEDARSCCCACTQACRVFQRGARC